MHVRLLKITSMKMAHDTPSGSTFDLFISSITLQESLTQSPSSPAAAAMQYMSMMELKVTESACTPSFSMSSRITLPCLSRLRSPTFTPLAPAATSDVYEITLGLRPFLLIIWISCSPLAMQSAGLSPGTQEATALEQAAISELYDTRLGAMPRSSIACISSTPMSTIARPRCSAALLHAVRRQLHVMMLGFSPTACMASTTFRACDSPSSSCVEDDLMHASRIVV
mmetsp:Transcript_33139/g.104806  ORF Transcript_33139/g.104806 Transcript_33139/m.104806 type:complete len:226 (-) Transcript_33139:1597-2274(-)